MNTTPRPMDTEITSNRFVRVVKREATDEWPIHLYYLQETDDAGEWVTKITLNAEEVSDIASIVERMDNA